jgi:phospholipid/cholesterol/gamma-HCH transport system substrate-binding protein
METRAHYVLIGFFMLSVIFLTLMFALWLGSVEREYDEYDVIFRERVSGLSVGSTVLFNGINVGEVRDLNLAPNNPNEVIAKVRVSKGTPIKTDTTAELELVGITGLVAIQFTGGSPNAELLKLASRERTPLIEAQPSGIAQLLESSGNILEAAQRTLSPENTESVTNILNNIETITEGLASDRDRISSIIKNVDETSANIAVITARLEKSSKRFDSILDEVDRLMASDISTAVNSFSNSAVEAELLMRDMRAVLEENRAALKDFSEQGLGQASAAIADSRRLMRTIDSILKEIERDPAKFFFGDTRPTYNKSR